MHLLYEELSCLVARDSLTEVSTRDHFFERLSNEPDAYGVSLMVDINFFKKLNDAYGHLTGDLVIKHVVQILQCMQK